MPVLSPTVAGSIVKDAGPAKYPVSVVLTNVGEFPVPTPCAAVVATLALASM